MPLTNSEADNCGQSMVSLSDAGLLRLLQLSSVSLPVGGYAFSQGLEYAIDIGWLRNQAQVHDWLQMQIDHALAQVDLPLLRLMMQAAADENWAEILRLNDLALACRETKELRLTDTAMGEALARLLNSLSVPHPFNSGDDISFVSLFTVAAQQWQVSEEAAVLGFSWAWLENQVAAATKLVPLGQTQAQLLLGELQPVLLTAIESSATLDEDRIGAGLPALAIASALHEQQYSRLFRS